MILKMKKKNNLLCSPFLSQSSTDTIELAYQFGLSLSKNTVIALKGDLGAGKTTFVKGIAKALGISNMDIVTSPTFSYLNIYDSSIPIFHFDLYRMKSLQDFFSSGFEEYFSADGVCCIEWPDIAAEALPKNTILVDFSHRGTLEREIFILNRGDADEAHPL
jgi:tRNA threonylcarbamoyladenosine biosynthesis protein TsaE